MTESLRDAIAAAPCLKGDDNQWDLDCHGLRLQHAECAEAAALKWFADWLRSLEAPSGPCTFATTAECCPYHEGRKAEWARVAALADALTKESVDPGSSSP